MKRAILIPLAALSACASPNSNYVPRMVAISEPPIGVIVQKNIGDTLVRQGTFSTIQAIKIESSVKVGAIGTYTLGQGYYVKQGEDSNSEYYQPEISPEGGRIAVGALTDPFRAVQYMKDGSKICGVSAFGMHVCKENPPVTRTERNALSANSFQQALIYSGRFGDKLRIGYRESSNNMARPAFNNEVEYDLSQSKFIGYKGAKLEVIEATNEYIKFRVVSNFNDAAQ